MRVVVLFNPVAGRGRAKQVAARAIAALDDAGHETTPVEVGPAAVRSDLNSALASAHAAGIVGGDGTVHALAPLAARHGVPIYHLPTGTENLFAREFGMTPEPGGMLQALGCLDERDPSASVPHIDIATCNARPFLLMASLGFDANVVHRLATARKGSISHLSYVPHIARELLLHRSPRTTIKVDGREVVSGTPGWTVIANARQYALRVDPVPHADPSDGTLDIGFFPYRAVPRLTAWNLLARLRLAKRSLGAVSAAGRHIRVETDREVPYQLDGEAPLDTAGRPDLGPALTPLEIEVGKLTLPVLTASARPGVAGHRPVLPGQECAPSPALRGALARGITGSASE